MPRLLLILCLSLSINTFAGVIKDNAIHLKEIGTVATFQWAPDSYNSDFRYDILYYIPQNLKDAEKVKALIFMHGGGSSTLTREGSFNMASFYMNKDLVTLADDLGMVVIAPSASGLNWGGHTYTMIRSLSRLVRTELSVDHDNIGLSGHSMGGMGIGRSFPLLTDEFAYFLPMSSGIDPLFQKEEHLNKAFNVSYVQLQGLKDHFKIFVERGLLQLQNTQELERKYGTNSLLEVIFYEGAHNYDLKLFRETLKRLQSTGRNLFQRNLYGTLYYNDNFYTENNIQFHQGPAGRYFWVEIAEASGSTPERLDFMASICNNTVHLRLKQTPENIKSLRINLSKNLVESERPISFMLNDVLVTQIEELRKNPRSDEIDESYNFEDSVLIALKEGPTSGEVIQSSSEFTGNFFCSPQRVLLPGE